MARALVRICVEVGKERAVRDQLRSFEEVEMAEITAGEQDVVTIVKKNSLEEILMFVSEKIRSMSGIKITWTNFILD